jgi:hypothetical protein
MALGGPAWKTAAMPARRTLLLAALLAPGPALARPARATTARLPAGRAGAREQVVLADFLGHGRSPAEALALAIDRVWRNNGEAGGEVLLPPGPPLPITEPVAARPHVTVRGPARLHAPGWTRRDAGLFHVDGVRGFAISDLEINTGRRARPVWVDGGATGLRLSRLLLVECRSLWFEKGGEAELSDIAARRGTALLGCGTDHNSAVHGIRATRLDAEDMMDEAVDLNFNVGGVRISHFAFRRCSLARPGEMIDIGGGECHDIEIEDGELDCAGSAHPVAGVRIKLDSHDIRLGRVTIRGGRADGFGFHLARCERIAIRGCHVARGFGRGFFSEPTVREVSWRGGTCDAPLHVNGGQDLAFDIVHDASDEESTAPAFNIGFGARRISVAGRVANRPRAAAVALGATTGGARDCTVEGLVAERVRRGVEARPGTAGLRINDLVVRQSAAEAVFLADGVAGTALRDVVAEDYSLAAPRHHAAIRLGEGGDGTVLRRITARDTRAEAGRTSGPLLAVDGVARGVVLGEATAQNLPVAPLRGLSRLSESEVATVATAAHPVGRRD